MELKSHMFARELAVDASEDLQLHGQGGGGAGGEGRGQVGVYR